MEATQKNLVNDASVSQKLSGIYPKFDLDKSYTALRMNVKAILCRCSRCLRSPGIRFGKQIGSCIGGY